jgi:hypothetical protein
MPNIVSTIEINEAEELNLICRRGDRFSLEIELYNAVDGTPYDMANYTSALMQVRTSASSEEPVAEFSTSGSSETGLITIDPVNSKVLVERLVFDIDPGDYVYDLELVINTGAIQTILSGRILVRQDVSRASS